MARSAALRAVALFGGAGILLITVPWQIGRSDAAGGSMAVSLLPGEGLTVRFADGRVDADISATVTAANAGHLIGLPLEPFRVIDSTGTGNGWHVTVQTAPPVGPNGYRPVTAGVWLAPPQIVCSATISCSGRAAPPSTSMTALTAIDGSDGSDGATLASASPRTGMGAYSFLPGTIDSTVGHALGLLVPVGSPPGVYRTLLTLSMTSGP